MLTFWSTLRLQRKLLNGISICYLESIYWILNYQLLSQGNQIESFNENHKFSILLFNFSIFCIRWTQELSVLRTNPILRRHSTVLLRSLSLWMSLGIRSIELMMMVRCVLRIFRGKILRFIWGLNYLIVNVEEICGNSIQKLNGFIILRDMQWWNMLTIQWTNRESKMNRLGRNMLRR